MSRFDPDVCDHLFFKFSLYPMYDLCVNVLSFWQLYDDKYSRHKHKLFWIYTVVHKNVHFYFLNSSVQHRPILIIFGMQHQKETWRKWFYFWLPHFNTVATLRCEMQVVEPAVFEWCQRLSLAFVLEEDILSTWCNNKDVMWHVTFWDTIVFNRVCRFSVNHFWADSCAIQYEFIVVNGQTTTSAFYKVV